MKSILRADEKKNFSLLKGYNAFAYQVINKIYRIDHITIFASSSGKLQS